MTEDEFLAWQARQELRYEFDGVGPLAMAGTREAHADIQANLITALRNRLRGRECRAYGADMMVSVDGSFHCPDGLIVCGLRHSHRLIALNPVVVSEIVSERAAATDRLKKNLEYRTRRLSSVTSSSNRRPSAPRCSRVREATGPAGCRARDRYSTSPKPAPPCRWTSCTTGSPSPLDAASLQRAHPPGQAAGRPLLPACGGWRKVRAPRENGAG